MLNFRLAAFEKWKKLTEPDWAFLSFQKPDYQNIRYYFYLIVDN
jgi:Fe-S cluster assembly protein SufB